MKCDFCKKEISDINYKVYKRKRYHYDCFSEMQRQAEQNDLIQGSKYSDKAYKSLVDYILRIYKLPSLPYLIEKQIADFASKYGYTYSGMEKTLEYFYFIRGNAIQSASIGIIPYQYDEAKEYYEWIFKVNNTNAQIDVVEETVSVKITPPQRDIPGQFNIEDL